MRSRFDPAVLEAQARRYDIAMSAVSRIATMRLDTLDQAKAALGLVDGAGADLRHQPTKLLHLIRSDATFGAAVRSACPDAASAGRFAKSLRADPGAVFALDGGAAVALRVRESLQADGRTMARIAHRFKEARRRMRAVPGIRGGGGTLPPSVVEFGREIGEALANSMYGIKANGLLGLMFGPAILTALDLLGFGDLDASLVPFAKWGLCLDAAYKKRAECTAMARNQIPPDIGVQLQYAGDWADLVNVRCIAFALSTSTVVPSFSCC
jgi:hypothetical protein